LTTQAFTLDSVQTEKGYQPRIASPFANEHDLAAAGVSQEVIDQTPEDQRTVLLIEKLLEPYQSGTKLFGDIPLRLHQLWTSINWVREHGTVDAARRFIDKLTEEADEFLREHQVIKPTPSDLNKKLALMQQGVLADNPETKFLDELGDLVFVAAALATVARADVEAGTAHATLEMYGHAQRFITPNFIDGVVINGLSRTDRLYPNGQMPWLVRTLYLDEDQAGLDDDPGRVLTLLVPPLAFGVDRPEHELTSEVDTVVRFLQAGLLNRTASVAQAELLTGYGVPDAAGVERTVGALMIYASYWARVYGNSTLGQTLKMNMRKVNQRVIDDSLDDRTKR
jgi:hypothetical protein